MRYPGMKGKRKKRVFLKVEKMRKVEMSVLNVNIYILNFQEYDI